MDAADSNARGRNVQPQLCPSSVRFIYDLVGIPKPKDDELDEEIERLMYIKTAEMPNYLVSSEDVDQTSALNDEILSLWLTKKFKTTLILLFMTQSGNTTMARKELAQMERYNTIVDKFLRSTFLERHALKRVKETFFADSDLPELEHAVKDLKRTLTFISEHLRQNSPDNLTLFNTDAYTTADVTLYNFLKRIIVGKYSDFGLEHHIRLCEPLVKFMRRYAAKNLHVIDISGGDPLAKQDESSLIADIVKPATVGAGFILFYLWCRRSS